MYRAYTCIAYSSSIHLSKHSGIIYTSNNTYIYSSVGYIQKRLCDVSLCGLLYGEVGYIVSICIVPTDLWLVYGYFICFLPNIFTSNRSVRFVLSEQHDERSHYSSSYFCSLSIYLFAKSDRQQNSTKPSTMEQQ